MGISGKDAGASCGNSRSVYVSGDQYFSTHPQQRTKAEEAWGASLLGDQPLSTLDLSVPGVEEIAAAEFEEIWERAKRA